MCVRMSRFVLLLFISTTSTQILIPKIEINTEMITCVMTIIDEYVGRSTVVFYTEEETNSVLWVKLIAGMKKPFMVVSQTLKLSEAEQILVVLFPKPDTIYTQILQNLRKDSLYIVVGTEEFEQFDMIHILSEFHNSKMIFNIFLAPGENRIDIYTSFPYSENHCAGTGPPIQIDSYLYGKFTQKAHLFLTRKYWNMYGCTLICLSSTQPPDAILALGENGEIVFQKTVKKIMDILSEKLNFIPKIILPQENNPSLDRSWFFYNDTIDQTTDYLANEQVDFGIGLFSQLAYTNDSVITFGKETHFECYTWAVPIRAGKKRFVIMNYIDEFSLSFWIIFIVSIIVAVFIIVGITVILGENTTLQSPFNVLQFIFSTILNQPFPVKPKPWSLRIFIAHWLVYVLVITTAYQASLWSFMTIPWQVHNIQSLQDLLDSPLEIGGAQQMLNILRDINSNNENLKKLIQKFKVLPASEFSEILHRIETKRDFAVFGEKRHLRSYSQDIDQIFYTDRVYFIDGCVLQSLVTPLLFPKGSPLYQPINTMLIRLLQNGIINKFFENFGTAEISQYTRETINHTEIPQHTDAINLTQFRGIFLILLFGYGISFVVFVCEIIAANMSRNQHKVNVIIGPKLYHRHL